MAASRLLNHVTLTTGHLSRSPRSQADPAAIDAVGEGLARALARGETVEIDTPTPGCTLEATTAGRALIATLYGPGGRPWVTLGVAPKSTVAPKLWGELTSQLAPYHAMPRPQTPWAAAILHVPDTPEWVGDWERCIAWAWIEGGHEG